MFTRRATPPSTRSPASRALFWATFVLPTVLLVGAITAFGFEDPSPRERAEIARLLGLEPGMTVADIGAGDGRYAQGLAERVGPTGQVYATEVDERRIRQIERNLERHGVDNVAVVVGDQENTGLPEGSCDAILLRGVYHRFVDPAAMRAGMRWALKPGGRLLVIDSSPAEGLIEKMSADGWRVVERVRAWNGREGHYAVVFRPDETS